MPQFDFFSFFVQIFWIILGCIAFYLIQLQLVIRKTAEVIKMRKKLIDVIAKSNATKNSSFLYNTVIQYFSPKN